MNNNKSESKALPPYVSYRTFRNFVERMHEGIPSRIDRSVMGGSMAGGTVTQLLTALKSLELIDENGKPQGNLEQLAVASGDEYRSILESILRNAYPNVFKLDLKRASAQEFRERFKEFTTKDDVVNKCQAFFRQAAEDAGIELSPYIKERAKVSGQPRKHRKPRRGDTSQTSKQELPRMSRHSIEEMILQKYPEFNPEWDKGTQDAWMKGIMKLYAELKGEEEKGDEEKK
jgi:hypothetical protein